MKSSRVEDKKVAMEYVVGVITGSTAKLERRRIGLEWVTIGEMMLWRMVGKKRLEGQRYDDKFRRF